MELLDLAPVRSPSRRCGVHGLASGLRPGPALGHYHILFFRRADKSSLSDPAVPTRKRHLGVTLRVGNE